MWAKLTRDQTTEAAYKGIVDWNHRVRLPHKVRMDGGGSFWSRLIEKLTHVYTTPYHSELNGGVERAVRLVKHCLTRDNVKKVTQELLDKITFSINNN